MPSTPPKTPIKPTRQEGLTSSGASGTRKRKRDNSPGPDLTSKQPKVGSSALASRQVILAGQSGVLDNMLGWLFPCNAAEQKEAGITSGFIEQQKTHVRAMIFIVKHEVSGEDINRILRGHHLYDAKTVLIHKEWSKAVTEWQRKVLNFVSKVVTAEILPAVKGTASDPMKMDDIGARFQVWADFYNKNPANVAKNMWAPVKWVIDWDAIYDTPKCVSQEIASILKKWRNYFLQCFVMAADYSFLFRNAAKEDPEVVAEFLAAHETEYTLFRSTPLDDGLDVPDITEIPVSEAVLPKTTR
ncbi:uncharacterized protein J3D65DRAFT_666996 [Phyllosticta citribraziliensis]|uniref:Uncharacterized protein n=1 Tax=Phyllosticta citribraziliensis TaxID=989973 RepID=A0ABR1LW60_9PEZI